MSRPPAGQHTLDAFGTARGGEPAHGPLPSDAGRLPRRPFGQRSRLTQPCADARDDPRHPARVPPTRLERARRRVPGSRASEEGPSDPATPRAGPAGPLRADRLPPEDDRARPPPRSRCAKASSPRPSGAGALASATGSSPPSTARAAPGPSTALPSMTRPTAASRGPPGTAPTTRTSIGRRPSPGPTTTSSSRCRCGLATFTRPADCTCTRQP
jgi:hypothetical protein